LIEAGVRSVTVACLDPNPVAGGGLAELTPFGIRVASGLEVLAAEQVNRKWLTAMRRQSPYVIAKVAISLDGRIALATGESRWITGESARNKVHQLRAECGAVLVGRKTAELDRAQLTVRTLETQNQPTRIVLDPAGQLPLDLPIFDSQAPTLWMVSNPTRDKQIPLPQDGVPGIVGGLFRRGLTSVLVEGGATTISQFIAAEAVDELCIFVAPKLLGNGPSWFNEVGIDHLDQAFRWRFDEPVSVGDDLLIRARPVTSTASNR
jgi:diaminohydroxyphosphoribosylaminopyrimidine deaminase/5-amino-6-(5-phosphoribosylamino)uracil reductase